MIRIVLTGAECTGKTTLTQALSDHYREPMTSEYARVYVNEVRRPLTCSDVEPIAKGQLKHEDSVLSAARKLVLHDTNLLSTILYSNHYYGLQLDWLNDTFSQRNYTLYLLSSPAEIGWEEDLGQRDSPEARETLHGLFRDSLLRLKLPTVELHGSREERFSKAVSTIDRLLLR